MILTPLQILVRYLNPRRKC